MSLPRTDKRRVRVFYSGRVQGVGFRFTAETMAHQKSVVGYVKNLSDGRVEIVAEAEEAVLGEFLNKIEERMKYYISSEDVEYSGATGEFSGFEIRF